MTGDKVVRLDGRPHFVAGEANPALVKAIEDVLQRAKKGELRSFIGTGFNHDGSRLVIKSGDLREDVHQMLGALAWLQHEYVHDVTGDQQPT